MLIMVEKDVWACHHRLNGATHTDSVHDQLFNLFNKRINVGAFLDNAQSSDSATI